MMNVNEPTASQRALAVLNGKIAIYLQGKVRADIEGCSEATASRICNSGRGSIAAVIGHLVELEKEKNFCDASDPDKASEIEVLQREIVDTIASVIGCKTFRIYKLRGDATDEARVMADLAREFVGLSDVFIDAMDPASDGGENVTKAEYTKMRNAALDLIAATQSILDFSSKKMNKRS